MIFQCMVALCVVITNIFVYCYFGQQVTSKFAEVHPVIYEMHWHEYPVDLQKYLILMLMRSQRTFSFKGYMTTCSLATFKAVSTHEHK